MVRKYSRTKCIVVVSVFLAALFVGQEFFRLPVSGGDVFEQSVSALRYYSGQGVAFAYPKEFEYEEECAEEQSTVFLRDKRFSRSGSEIAFITLTRAPIESVEYSAYFEEVLPAARFNELLGREIDLLVKEIVDADLPAYKGVYEDSTGGIFFLNEGIGFALEWHFDSSYEDIVDGIFQSLELADSIGGTSTSTSSEQREPC